MMAAIAGAIGALGLLILLRGMFPADRSLARHLAEFNDRDDLVIHADDGSALVTFAVTVLETVKGDDMASFLSDLEVANITIEHAAVERLKGAGGAAAFGLAFGMWVGLFSGTIATIVVGLIAGIGGYLLPDLESKKKALQGRQEFERSLTAFITLLASSISGGGGLSTGMDDAVTMGRGWVFTKLRFALEEAKLSGISPWVAFDELGRRLQVPALVELAGSLTLAGTAGARVTETLAARAESARSKELTDTRSEAEARSSSLGIPVGLMLLAWAVFMGYPALTGLGFS